LLSFFFFFCFLPSFLCVFISSFPFLSTLFFHFIFFPFVSFLHSSFVLSSLTYFSFFISSLPPSVIYFASSISVAVPLKKRQYFLLSSSVDGCSSGRDTRCSVHEGKT
jgi:hypothetical protein